MWGHVLILLVFIESSLFEGHNSNYKKIEEWIRGSRSAPPHCGVVGRPKLRRFVCAKRTPLLNPSKPRLFNLPMS